MDKKVKKYLIITSLLATILVFFIGYDLYQLGNTTDYQMETNIKLTYNSSDGVLKINKTDDTQRATLPERFAEKLSQKMDITQVKQIEFEAIVFTPINSESLFQGFTGLEEFIEMGKLHSDNTTTMKAMFKDCHSLKDIDIYSDFDTTQVTDMSYMFDGCYNLRGLDEDGSTPKDCVNVPYNTQNVTTMEAMFRDCRSVVQIKGIGYLSNVEDMSEMFKGCTNLEKIPNSFQEKPAEKIEDMSEMFKDCSSIKELSFPYFDTSNVTDMNEMFKNCTSLEQLDISSFDMSNVGENYQDFLTGDLALDLLITPKVIPQEGYIILPGEFYREYSTGEYDIIYEEEDGQIYEYEREIYGYDLHEDLSDREIFSEVVELHRNKYKTTYKANNGQDDADIKIPSTGNIGISKNPFDAIPGWEFESWNTEPDGTGTRFEPGDWPVVEDDEGFIYNYYELHPDITLYAQWTYHEFDVTLDNQNATTPGTTAVVATYGSPMPEIVLPQRLGYFFGGYFTMPNGEGEQYYSETGQSVKNWDKKQATTLYAYWIASESTSYRIEYYLRDLDIEVVGYKICEPETVIRTGKTDTTATAKEADYKTINGFTVLRNHPDNILSTNINGDGSGFLRLYYDRNTYTITYNLNGGTSSYLDNTYVYGKEFVLPNKNIVKDGCVFLGWYDNENFEGNPITKITSSEIGNKTFYAKWSEENEFYITSDIYMISDDDITRVSPLTTIGTFISHIQTNGEISIFDLNDEKLSYDDLVGTGFKLTATYNNVDYVYIIAVRGDVNGDGKAKLLDLSFINQHLVNKIVLTGIKAKAADINYDGKIALLDSSLMNQYLVGKITL